MPTAKSFSQIYSTCNLGSTNPVQGGKRTQLQEDYILSFQSPCSLVQSTLTQGFQLHLCLCALCKPPLCSVSCRKGGPGKAQAGRRGGHPVQSPFSLSPHLTGLPPQEQKQT